MRSRIAFDVVAVCVILGCSLSFISLRSVDAVKSKRPVNGARRPSTMSDVEYFQRRWSARGSSSSPDSLIDILHSVSSAVTPSTESLSIRGGSSAASQIASSQLYAVNIANESIVPQPNIATVTEKSLAVQPRIPFLQFFLYPAQTSRHKSFGILRGTAANKQLARLSALTFVLSNVIFFAGTHLETVWTNTKPYVRQWLQGSAGRTDKNKRSKVLSYAYGHRRTDPSVGRRRLYLTLAVTIGLFASPLLTTVGGATVLCAQKITEASHESDNVTTFL